MKFKVAFAIAFCFGALAGAQQRNPFPQPTAAKEVMVTAIPGVIAAGAKWKLVWQGPDYFSVEGKQLGIIPLPRSASSVAFSGPNKKVLYAKGAGMTMPDGSEYRTPESVRNNAKAIYRIDMIAQGFTGRPK